MSRDGRKLESGAGAGAAAAAAEGTLISAEFEDDPKLRELVDDYQAKQEAALGLLAAAVPEKEGAKDEEEGDDGLKRAAAAFYNEVIAVAEWADAADRLVDEYIAKKKQAATLEGKTASEVELIGSQADAEAAERYQKSPNLHLHELAKHVDSRIAAFLKVEEIDTIAKAINRLPCKDEDRSDQGRTLRSLLYSRCRVDAIYPLLPKPDLVSNLNPLLLQEISVAGVVSYQCVPYVYGSESSETPHPPLVGTTYAFVKRWNPLALKFETIVRSNLNGSGLHYQTAGHCEFVVAVGEVTFREETLEGDVRVYSVDSYTRQSGSYRPRHGNQFLTGFNEGAYTEFEEGSDQQSQYHPDEQVSLRTPSTGVSPYLDAAVSIHHGSVRSLAERASIFARSRGSSPSGDGASTASGSRRTLAEQGRVASDDGQSLGASLHRRPPGFTNSFG